MSGGGQSLAAQTRGLEDIDTPAVLADLDAVERNVERAAMLCRAADIALRPHIKTHKIAEFARLQMRAGAVGITCQKLSEAEAFAESGMEDILISFNIVGERKLRRLRALAAKMRIQTVADNDAVVAELSSCFADGEPLEVMAECDTGGGRCGAQTPAAAAALAAAIHAAPGLRFAGFMTYPPPNQIEKVNDWLSEAAAQCAAAGIACPTVSNGGTPDLHRLRRGGAANEYRAGTYLYNDRSIVARGACGLEDCALTVLATVVSTPVTGRAIIDAGSKILSSDLLGLSDYGELLGAPDIRAAALSEEHGILHLPPGAPTLRPGDRVRVIPNHACVVGNLAGEVVAIRGNAPQRTIPLISRGGVT